MVMSAVIVKELMEPSEYNSATFTGNINSSVNTPRSRGIVSVATLDPLTLVALILSLVPKEAWHPEAEASSAK